MADTDDDSIERLKIAARERAGKELSDSDASALIDDFFDASPSPSQLSQAQVDQIVETLLPPE
jgi:hypothetical protein